MSAVGVSNCDPKWNEKEDNRAYLIFSYTSGRMSTAVASGNLSPISNSLFSFLAYKNSSLNGEHGFSEFAPSIIQVIFYLCLKLFSRRCIFRIELLPSKLNFQNHISGSSLLELLIAEKPGVPRLQEGPQHQLQLLLTFLENIQANNDFIQKIFPI